MVKQVTVKIWTLSRTMMKVALCVHRRTSYLRDVAARMKMVDDVTRGHWSGSETIETVPVITVETEVMVKIMGTIDTTTVQTKWILVRGGEVVTAIHVTLVVTGSGVRVPNTVDSNILDGLTVAGQGHDAVHTQRRVEVEISLVDTETEVDHEVEGEMDLTVGMAVAGQITVEIRSACHQPNYWLSS
jgi:hypothetical protein